MIRLVVTAANSTHLQFHAIRETIRPSSDAVRHMSRIEYPLFSLIGIRFGSCEVRRLNLALESFAIIFVGRHCYRLILTSATYGAHHSRF